MLLSLNSSDWHSNTLLAAAVAQEVWAAAWGPCAICTAWPESAYCPMLVPVWPVAQNVLTFLTSEKGPQLPTYAYGKITWVLVQSTGICLEPCFPYCRRCASHFRQRLKKVMCLGNCTLVAWDVHLPSSDVLGPKCTFTQNSKSVQIVNLQTLKFPKEQLSLFQGSFCGICFANLQLVEVCGECQVSCSDSILWRVAFSMVAGVHLNILAECLWVHEHTQTVPEAVI